MSIHPFDNPLCDLKTCRQPFTDQEWNERHQFFVNGEHGNFHTECCPKPNCSDKQIS